MWYYSVANDQQEGPVDEEVVHELYERGLLDDSGLVWRDGMADWISYADAFPEQAQAVRDRQSAQLPAAPQSLPQTLPQDAAQQVGTNPYQAPRPTAVGPYPPAVPGTGLAIASMIVGGLSIFVGLLCCAPFGIGGGILAIVMSQLAKGEVTRAPALPDGMQVMAQRVQTKIKIGLITGIAAVATSCLGLLISLVFNFVLHSGRF